jgi:Xaa-Pro aminopeptidase
MDMGAEYHFYASDITCSYPVSTWKLQTSLVAIVS